MAEVYFQIDEVVLSFVPPYWASSLLQVYQQSIEDYLQGSKNFEANQNLKELEKYEAAET